MLIINSEYRKPDLLIDLGKLIQFAGSIKQTFNKEGLLHLACDEKYAFPLMENRINIYCGHVRETDNIAFLGQIFCSNLAIKTGNKLGVVQKG